MKLRSREGLLIQLADELKGQEERLSRVDLGCIEITLSDGNGAELSRMSLPYAVDVLASELWQDSDGVDLSDATYLHVRVL